MKKINKQTFLLHFSLLLLFTPFLHAEPITYKFAFVGNKENSAHLGAQQGLDEANLQGRFLNQKYTMDIISSEQALNNDYSPYIAVITAVDQQTYRKLTNLLPGKPVFNVWLEDDSLRAECISNALHIVPSKQMKIDAVAQWHQLHPDAQVTAQTWHHDFVKFAARDLNKRFSKSYNTRMDDAAWAGWAAVKMSSDSIARHNIPNSADLLDYLKTKLVFDGQMGIEMDFRPTGQLRQPMLLIENGEITGEAPVRGVADPPTVDSLGYIECSK